MFSLLTTTDKIKKYHVIDFYLFIYFFFTTKCIIGKNKTKIVLLSKI